jgi:ribosomal protein S18 acetylase RimI-like enzyme
MEPDPQRIRARLDDPTGGTTAFVADEAGRVVGWAVIGPSRNGDGTGELYGLYVDPDAWSRGVGRELMARVEEALAARYDDATLWVLDDNPRARRFYERGGWAADGGRAGFDQRGFSAEVVRYRKRLSRPASRA